MKVVLVRHGESTGNAGIPCFDLSKLELTPLGYAQSERVAAAWQDRPTLIAVSPYLRTHQTAKATIARFPDVPVEVLPAEEFTYLDPERWNGTSRDMRLPYIEAYWKSGDPAYCDGAGAESFDTLLGRVGRCFKRLEALPAGSLVYLFSHGQFMQAVRVRLLNPTWTSKQLMEHFWPFNSQYPILNTDLLEINHEDGTWRA